jgi:hypothetical protein
LEFPLFSFRTRTFISIKKKYSSIFFSPLKSKPVESTDREVGLPDATSTEVSNTNEGSGSKAEKRKSEFKLENMIGDGMKNFRKYQLAVWLSIQNLYSHFTKVFWSQCRALKSLNLFKKTSD